MSSLKKMFLLVALFLFVSQFAQTCFAQNYYSLQLNTLNYIVGKLPQNIQLAQVGDAQAQFEYGICLLDGIGCPKNPSLGFKLINLSASQGYIPAVYVMGRFYLIGQFVPKNIPEAIRIFQITGANGFSPSQVILGDCYLKGIGVPQNVQLAIKCYWDAYNNGNLDAFQRLRALGIVL